MQLNKESNSESQKLVFLGLDNAGKSSIILALLREISKFAIIKPTKNAEIRTFEFLGMNIVEWDLGGHKNYRKLYLEKTQQIFQGTDILIYVVDVQDYYRIGESYAYLKDVITKLAEVNILPPIHIFYHKNDPDINESTENKINDSISFFQNKIKEVRDYERYNFYKTTVFDLSGIINVMSEILLGLFPRSELIETAIKEFVNKCLVEGVELIDDNSLIVGSYYKNNTIKELLNALSPYFLRLNDEFERIDNLDGETENHIIVERFGKYFIFKQFTLIKDETRYYILICIDEPFLNKDEFNALINLLRDIVSYEF